MQNYFYRDKAGKEIGPLNLTTLAQLRFAGVLNDETPVRGADSDKWIPCREIVAASAAPASVQQSHAQPVNAGKEKSSLSPVLVGLVILGALVYSGSVLYKKIAAETALTYGFSVDGKEISKGQIPEVKVDGQSFDSGGNLKPGRHEISVHLENAEPYEQRFWVFYGTKDLGNLPLETSKGSLSVTVSPSPATVTVQRNGQTVNQGAAPLSVEKLPVGNYTLLVKRGDYEETHSVMVQRQQQTETNVVLNLGVVDLSAAPADAEYKLSGNGKHWQGELPTSIDDVPVGDYTLSVTRRGWELDSDVLVIRGGIVTNTTEFPYGTVAVTSEPTGLVVSTNGVEIGKTPMTLQELKPMVYDLTISDGENDLAAKVNVGQKENARHAFIFRYGTIQLMSTPAGATVIRKGKELGKTPLTLDRVPVGDSRVGLTLDGYLATNLMVSAAENATTNFSVKLVSEQYLQAMSQAQEALDAGQLGDAKTAIAKALTVDPDNAAAISLQSKIGEAEQAAEKARAQAEQRAVAEKRRTDEARFQQVIASTKNSEMFPTQSKVYSFDFDKTWNATVNVLTQQKEDSIHSSRETGIITTGFTRHSLLLVVAPHYDQYVVLVEKNDANTTTISIRLLSFSPDLDANGRQIFRPLPRGGGLGISLEQVANGFFNKIGQTLNPPNGSN
jgi:hypothetical protein